MAAPFGLGPDLTSERLLLGRRVEVMARRYGFRPPTPLVSPPGELILDGIEGHCLMIAPTGAGKGRNVIIPNALTYRGSMILIDPKGEAATVTGPRRAAMGQRVYYVEPFARSGSRHGINPLHHLDPTARDYRSSLRTVVRTLTGGVPALADRFWEQTAEDFLVGVLAYFVEYRPLAQRTLAAIRAFLCDADLSYKVAVALDTELSGRTGPAIEEFVNFLGHEGEKVRTSVRSTAVQHLSIFAEAELGAALDVTSFPLSDIVEGAPITIFLIVPPTRLEAYAPLIRLWVTMLMSLVAQRTSPPDLPTLFVLDELAQLGSFPLLRPAVTLMRSYGLKTLLVVQDLSQLQAMFPTDARTIVNNCATVLTFGHTGLAMSQDISALLGDVGPEALFEMPFDMLAIRQHGERTRFVRRLDYVTEPDLAGLAAPNPMIA
jgi:type IV secretion system protein VirD4